MNKCYKALVLFAAFLCFYGPAMAGEKVFMWKAESGGSLVYLLGSIHMADESFYPLDPAIESAFDESSKLVVEVDITNQDQAALQSLVAARGLYQGDDSLDQHISAETMQAVASYLGEMEIIMQILVKLKPWAVYLTLEQLEMEKMGLNAEYGIDLHFLNKAKKDSKPVAQLESMEAQLNLISGFPDKTQEGMIMMTITEAEKRAESLGSVISAWKNGNASEMEEILFASLEQEPELAPVYEKMFFERNEAMAEKIAGLARHGRPLFVVVGAGHLLGERGVAQILERKDFKITQVHSGK